MNLDEIKEGSKVSYPFFKNLVFVGTDSRHVILKDKEDNEKKYSRNYLLNMGKLKNKVDMYE